MTARTTHPQMAAAAAAVVAAAAAQLQKGLRLSELSDLRKDCPLEAAAAVDRRGR